MPNQSDIKKDLNKIYREADEIAYVKATRSFSKDVTPQDPSLIDEEYENGEIEAYVKAVKSFNVDDLDAAADNLVKQYKAAEATAYAKAIKSFNTPFELSEISEHPSFAKGEEAAYTKAMASFNQKIENEYIQSFTKAMPSTQVVKGFFKNVPESLYIAKLMNSRDVAAKGMYIYNNWVTIYLLTKRMWETGMEMSWDAFKNFATDMSVFVEEVMEDMPDGSTQISQIPDLLHEIIELWPNLRMIAGGARIVYNDDDDAMANPLGNRYESVEVPGRKMEVLADVYSKTPEGTFIYTDELQRAVEEIKLKFKALFRVIIDMKGEIQKRSELYDSLLRLRQGLDRLQDIFDPKKLDKMTTLSNIDLAVVESIKQQLKDIYSNRYIDPQIAQLIKKIDDKIDIKTWFYRGSEGGFGPLNKLRRNINRVILRLNGSQIMEGLRAANAYYDQIWAAIHKGKQLTAPSRL